MKHPHCRQTKIFFPVPSRVHSKALLELNREDLGRCLISITGHNFKRRHNHIVNPTEYPNPYCRKCEEDTPETPSHIIADCPALLRLRILTFSTPELDLKTMNWSPTQLNQFLKLPNIISLEDLKK